MTSTIRRRPAAGGYARGNETRERIITTALRLFAERGFDAVSTREIAAAAGANPPALQYYFDGKDGLYRACAEYVAEGIRDLVEPMLRRAEQLLGDDAPTTALVEAYCALIEPLIDIVFDEQGAHWSPFLAADKEGCSSGAAFMILREKVVDRLDNVFVGLIGRLSGEPADASEIQLRAMAINGQFLMFYSKRPPFEPLTPAHTRAVKSMVLEQTRILLNHLAAHRTIRSRSPDSADPLFLKSRD
ncbi:CerR family C-terminal domain-containing protein [Agrobacterium sp. P15N1-A]|uniref:CerR family C-terminal domain-containing protein n=1 Tax=Agrobacterium sp. P15N1-A TaxID=3342820 RepID=UPI0037D31A16